ncbi:hypothetical protein SVIOM74S_00522 [Streptomyces violarus]
MTAPSGQRLPRSTATPPSAATGLSRVRMTSSLCTCAPASCSRSVSCETVGRSRWSRSVIRERNPGRPPAKWKSSIRYVCPPGRTLASTGTVRAMRSKSSRVSRTPARPAMAIRWITALVEPPRPSTVVTASWKASAVRMSLSFRSLWTSSTIVMPALAAIRSCPESTAGMLEAPGTVTPRASAAAVRVDAVPIVMQ